jgi:hypothetical protein
LAFSFWGGKTNGEDLKALGKKFSGKIRELPLTQKRILVSYLVPPACFVEVWPSDEPRRVKVNKFKRVQKWDYQLVSKANIKALLEVLMDLEASGEVTETYRDFRSLKEGIRK